MRPPKYDDDTHVFYYTGGTSLVSGHIIRSILMSHPTESTYLYSIKRFSKAGSVDSILEDQLISSEFHRMIKTMDI